MSDAERLPDPWTALTNLPQGGCVILRHPQVQQLERLAARVLPRAHALGLTVLIAGDVRLALKWGADGVHLSERAARCGPLRVRGLPPGFLITAAAHGRLALHRAHRAGAHAVLLSPVFATQSHPKARALGPLRFSILARQSAVPVIALGGVTAAGGRRLMFGAPWSGQGGGRGRAHGLAAIGAWLDRDGP